MSDQTKLRVGRLILAATAGALMGGSTLLAGICVMDLWMISVLGAK